MSAVELFPSPSAHFLYIPRKRGPYYTVYVVHEATVLRRKLMALVAGTFPQVGVRS
jgi:hypothetical protein